MEKKLHMFSKKALVTFLIAVFLLTILSRGLNSLTVPQVKVSTYKSGVIDYMVSGTGTVEAEEVRSVDIIPGLRIGKLAAFPGKGIIAGEALFYYQLEGILELYDKELRELEKLKISLVQEQIGSQLIPSLSETELANQALFKAGRNYEKAEAAWLQAQTDYEKKMTDLAASFAADKQKNSEQLLKERYEDWQSAERTYDAAVINEEEAVKQAKWALSDAESEVARLEAEGADSWEIQNAEAIVKRRRQEVYLTEDKWYLTVDQANADRHVKRKAYENMLNGTDDGLAALEKEYEAALEAEGKALEGEKEKLDSAAEGLLDANQSLENAIKRDSYSDMAANQQKELAALRQKLIELSIEEKEEEIARLYQLIEQEGAVTAPLNGTVMNLLLTAGQMTTGQEQVEIGIGSLLLKGTVDKEMAKYISSGDQLTLKKDGLPLRELNGQTEAIIQTADGEDYSLTARLSGSGGVIGSRLTFQVNSQTAVYDMIVPLSALREDNQNTYILFVEEKNTILGTEMVARRLDVTLLAKNSANAAISGSLTREMMIISDSSRFIQEGDRVRVISE